MSRPASIVAFERLYLGSLLLQLVSYAAFWRPVRDAVANRFVAQRIGELASLVTPMLIGSIVIGTAASLLLWWLVARRGSAVGKWLVVATEVIGAGAALLTLSRMVRGMIHPSVSVLITLLITGLAVAAAAMLFRRDATPWFARDDDRLVEP